MVRCSVGRIVAISGRLVTAANAGKRGGIEAVVTMELLEVYLRLRRRFEVDIDAFQVTTCSVGGVGRIHVIGRGASCWFAQPRCPAAYSRILQPPSTITAALLPLSCIVHRRVGVFELADALRSSEPVHVTARLWSTTLIVVCQVCTRYRFLSRDCLLHGGLSSVVTVSPFRYRIFPWQPTVFLSKTP